MSEHKSAIAGLFAVAIIWGVTYVLSAYLLRAFSPVLLSFLRICVTGVLLLAVSRTQVIQQPTRREWLLLLGSAVFFTLIQQPLYFIGLQFSTAANASLIYAVAPIATLFLEAIFLRTRFSWLKVAGALLGFLGVMVIVTFNGQSLKVSIGDVYLLIAMLGFFDQCVVYTSFIQKNVTFFNLVVFHVGWRCANDASCRR
ncbi:DMT family transporter [Paenibacillus qinlingensis]|uniref:DMT family transporter n=1 Tax=Paenibacillus qinlingensis TaxID=1837343 RepID=UPI002368EE30|nr:DMT family transporter [Paenibacillus qinlingensis]